MATEKVIPTEHELKGIELNSHDAFELIQHAQESDAADRQLTIRQALKKYKKAVFWAMFLSTSLVMEGYDLVIVSHVFFINWQITGSNILGYRSPPSTVRPNSNINSVSKANPNRAHTPFLPHGNLVYPTQHSSVNLLVSWSMHTHKIDSVVDLP